MNEGFTWETRGSIRYVSFASWTFLHGFTDKSLTLTKEWWSSDIEKFRTAFGVDAILVNNQDHTSVVVDARERKAVEDLVSRTGGGDRTGVVADGIIAPLAQPIEGKLVAFGIVTADCVPVIVRSTNGVALVHAGWRGLAQNILSEALRILGGSDMEAVVGPCAGPSHYEVGREVVDAIGDLSARRDIGGGKVLLDLPETTRRQVERLAPAARVANSALCTMTDTRFHSFRREGEAAGRGLTFYLPR